MLQQYLASCEATPASDVNDAIVVEECQEPSPPKVSRFRRAARLPWAFMKKARKASKQVSYANWAALTAMAGCSRARLPGALRVLLPSMLEPMQANSDDIQVQPSLVESPGPPVPAGPQSGVAPEPAAVHKQGASIKTPQSLQEPEVRQAKPSKTRRMTYKKPETAWEADKPWE